MGLLRESRDLLWAEAMEAHKAAESVMLPAELWEAAGFEQQKRVIEHPWTDMLDDISENVTRKDGHEYIATRALFQLLEIKPDRATAEHAKQLGMTMRKLGWDGPTRVRIDGHRIRGYQQLADPLFDDFAMFLRS